MRRPWPITAVTTEGERLINVVLPFLCLLLLLRCLGIEFWRWKSEITLTFARDPKKNPSSNMIEPSLFESSSQISGLIHILMASRLSDSGSGEMR